MLAAWVLASVLASAAAPGAASSVPPTPIFRSYGVAEGLPSANVYTVTQDHAGYLWIGTHGGLVRYDSREFRVFRHDPKQAASLPANDVPALLVDRAGRLWAGGENTGLNLYEPGIGGFRHWLHDPNQKDSLSANDLMAIAEDKSGAIWVGVYAGGLNKLDADEHGFSHLRHRKGDPASLVSDNVTALAPAADAGVDAATSAGLFHIAASGDARLIGVPHETLASLRGNDGSLWIAERGGLVRVGADGSTRFEQPTPGVAGSLPGHLPDGLFRDHEGGLWVAMVDGGLAYLPPQWRAFSMFRHVPGDPDSLT